MTPGLPNKTKEDRVYPNFQEILCSNNVISTFEVILCTRTRSISDAFYVFAVYKRITARPGLRGRTGLSASIDCIDSVKYTISCANHPYYVLVICQVAVLVDGNATLLEKSV